LHEDVDGVVPPSQLAPTTVAMVDMTTTASALVDHLTIAFKHKPAFIRIDNVEIVTLEKAI
jgi:hypothetical protein